MNLIQFFEDKVNKFPNNPLLWEKSENIYTSTSYSEVQKLVHEFAAGLLSMGLKKSERVAILSEGRKDWLISELAILHIGAISVPLSTKLEADNDLVFRLQHAQCRFIITSKQQLSKIRTVIPSLSEVEKTILFDEVETLHNNEIYKSEIVNSGIEYLINNHQTFSDIKENVTKNDVATITYTSGTTADPKGIMLSHRNYTANVEQAFSYIDIPQHYKTLVVLPWDHAFAHTATLYAFMYNGASIASVQVGSTALETLKNFSNNIQEIQPHILMSVPALAKNFKKNIEKGIAAKGKNIENLFNTALKYAYWYNGNGKNKGQGLKVITKPIYSLFNRILFNKVKTGFGGQLQYFIGGGALLDLELQQFFYAIGIPMYQGYGLSEAAPIISANTPKFHKMGSSGKVVNDLEIKICDDEGNSLPYGQKGEIVIKGENVMLGYWRNDTSTKETIKDNWLYTGDLGYLENDNYLYVLGRFKSLLIGADGEKYSPEGIEESIVEHCQYIDQVMLYNNQNPYTIGLVVPNIEKIKQYINLNQLNFKDGNHIETIISLINDDLSQFKTGGKNENQFPQRWLPSAISILPEAFTEQNKLLNSTLKMVRNKVVAHFNAEIENAYTAKGKQLNNQVNITNLKKCLEVQ